MRNSEDGTTVRQNSTYTPTRKHEVNLRRNPTLHFQIGLILALLAAIFFIEMQMPEQAHKAPRLDATTEDVFTMDTYRVEPKKAISVKKKTIKPKVQKPVIIDNPVKKLNDTESIESPIEPTDPVIDTPMVDPTTPDYIDYEDEDPVSIIAVEKVPLFPGCEGILSNDERRDCMSTKVSKFISRKFRTEKGEGLGLKGHNRIFVLFDIDTEGNVTDVRARGPHSNLEKEAKRVTELLPKMTPGKMGDRKVKVTMALPINFIIED